MMMIYIIKHTMCIYKFPVSDTDSGLPLCLDIITLVSMTGCQTVYSFFNIKDSTELAVDQVYTVAVIYGDFTPQGVGGLGLSCHSVSTPRSGLGHGWLEGSTNQHIFEVGILFVGRDNLSRPFQRHALHDSLEIPPGLCHSMQSKNSRPPQKGQSVYLWYSAGFLVGLLVAQRLPS